MTTPARRRVALLGMPLRRPHSAFMHNAAFAAYGIPARYELRELDASALPAAVAEARGADWLGFQVTAPHKRAVMELLDEVEDAAREIGAVNSVLRRDDGTLTGFNTDTLGFRAAVTAELGVELSGRRVVVAGTGGAAHAVVHACLEAGAEVTVAGRDPAAAARLAGRFAGHGRVRGEGLPHPRLDAALADAHLLVNATTVGMVEPGPVILPALLPSSATVYDLVYTPAETELLRQARQRGLPAANGLGMLVAQAAAAFTRWTGVADPGGTMRAALRPLLDAGHTSA